jgi:hypothetical protein
MKFFEQWDKLENLKAKVLLQHSLFGRQMHNCDSLSMINDDRVGLVLKGQEIYMDKRNIIYHQIENGMYTISDGNLSITIFVNKAYKG